MSIPAESITNCDTKKFFNISDVFLTMLKVSKQLKCTVHFSVTTRVLSNMHSAGKVLEIKYKYRVHEFHTLSPRLLSSDPAFGHGSHTEVSHISNSVNSGHHSQINDVSSSICLLIKCW